MVVLECSWRAGTVRIPAPPGCASVALACHALRLITGARVGSARPCTAWVRERRARVPRCASSQEQGSEVRVPAVPGCASVALACHAAPHHRSKGRKCASLHRLGARASRSRVALRLITGARVGSMRPCTAWVRERRARVSRCASSQEQGLEACVPALPGCASVALACRAAPHHRSKGWKHASLHRLGARASRSRATRCASSHKQQGRGMLRPCCDLSCCRLWGADHLL